MIYYYFSSIGLKVIRELEPYSVDYDMCLLIAFLPFSQLPFWSSKYLFEIFLRAYLKFNLHQKFVWFKFFRVKMKIFEAAKCYESLIPFSCKILLFKPQYQPFFPTSLSPQLLVFPSLRFCSGKFPWSLLSISFPWLFVLLLWPYKAKILLSI